MPHAHLIYRVIRRNWEDPLDCSYSQRRPDNRWNTPAFPALYACCSEQVGRAIALDRFRIGAINFEDLEPDVTPLLVEIEWVGELVDVASSVGIAAAGFPTTYPNGVTTQDTQKAAATWHADGFEGVVCRSATLARFGFLQWADPHEPWGEVAIFKQRAQRQPALRRERADFDWLQSPTERSVQC